MDLLVSQLKSAIRRILETKGVRARVLDKVNRYGEVVIGVILERTAPNDAPLAAPPDAARGLPPRAADPSPPSACMDDEVGVKRTVDTSHADPRSYTPLRRSDPPPVD